MHKGFQVRLSRNLFPRAAANDETQNTIRNDDFGVIKSTRYGIKTQLIIIEDSILGQLNTGGQAKLVKLIIDYTPYLLALPHFHQRK